MYEEEHYKVIINIPTHDSGLKVCRNILDKCTNGFAGFRIFLTIIDESILKKIESCLSNRLFKLSFMTNERAWLFDLLNKKSGLFKSFTLSAELEEELSYSIGLSWPIDWDADPGTTEAYNDYSYGDSLLHINMPFAIPAREEKIAMVLHALQTEKKINFKNIDRLVKDAYKPGSSYKQKSIDNRFTFRTGAYRIEAINNEKKMSMPYSFYLDYDDINIQLLSDMWNIAEKIIGTSSVFKADMLIPISFIPEVLSGPVFEKNINTECEKCEFELGEALLNQYRDDVKNELTLEWSGVSWFGYPSNSRYDYLALNINRDGRFKHCENHVEITIGIKYQGEEIAKVIHDKTGYVLEKFSFD